MMFLSLKVAILKHFEKFIRPLNNRKIAQHPSAEPTAEHTTQKKNFFLEHLCQFSTIFLYRKIQKSSKNTANISRLFANWIADPLYKLQGGTLIATP